MNWVGIILIYTVMMLFDFAVLAGTAYLIAVYDWSAAWMILAVFLCGTSSPTSMIKAVTTKEKSNG